MKEIEAGDLVSRGLDSTTAASVCERYSRVVQSNPGQAPGQLWMSVAAEVLTPNLPFEVHVFLRNWVFDGSTSSRPPLWYPSSEFISTLNVTRFMRSISGEGVEKRNLSVEDCQKSYCHLLQTAWRDPEFYWRRIIDFMDLKFIKAPERILTHSAEEDKVVWFKNCRLNIAAVALEAISANERAIVWADENRPAELCRMSGIQLKNLSYQIAAAIAANHPPGTSVAVYLPMTSVSVAMYLGIVLAGCVVVSIADSFATPEVQTRLRIANTRRIFTQDVTRRAGRVHDLYSKIADVTDAACVVLPENLKTLQCTLSPKDVSFESFLSSAPAARFGAVPCAADQFSNILFSSGTTVLRGVPKAIPWTQLVPLKCGVDGMLAQNIRADSIVCWPTSLGWMMGPWLLYAAFLNKAAIALFYGCPTSPAFCKFVEKAEVTMLGVIPSIVRAWKAKHMTSGCDWSKIQCFSSTGEASSYDEYHWLMAQAHYKPIIEYCGGTEVGGAYITGSMLHPQTPSGFTTPVVGTNVVCLQGDSILEITEVPEFEGELAIEPPMLGLSQTLLNRDHVEVYYQGMPRYGAHNYRLRRHGDAFLKQNGVFYSRGRCDDTMNLGGIKVGCVELEYAVMKTVKGVREAAAVGVMPESGGPEELVLFLVLSSPEPVSPESLRNACQNAVKQELNPLFRVSEVRVCDMLPRTSTAKITRNVLRDQIKRDRS